LVHFIIHHVYGAIGPLKCQARQSDTSVPKFDFSKQREGGRGDCLGFFEFYFSFVVARRTHHTALFFSALFTTHLIHHHEGTAGVDKNYDNNQLHSCLKRNSYVALHLSLSLELAPIPTGVV
jgi:hypothetical protein